MRNTIAVLALATTGLLACATPLNQTAPAPGLAAWTLESIDDRPLPYLQVQGSSIAQHEISNGILLLRSDGSFFMDVTYFVAQAGGPVRVSRIFEGLWSRSGNSFAFEFDNGGQNTASLTNGTLAMNIDGRRFSWVR